MRIIIHSVIFQFTENIMIDVLPPATENLPTLLATYIFLSTPGFCYKTTIFSQFLRTYRIYDPYFIDQETELIYSIMVIWDILMNSF